MTEKLDQNAVDVFIAGKNWKLSLAEIISYLKARSVAFKIIELSKPFSAIETAETLPSQAIEGLGGTIKIGQAIATLPTRVVQDAFIHRDGQAREDIMAAISKNQKTDEVFRSHDKSVFGVSVYVQDPHLSRFSWEMQRFLGGRLKKRFKEKGISSSFMGLPRNRKLPQLSHVEVLKKGLVDNSSEFLFCIGESRAFIARTIAVHNPFDFQKRDIGRPVQRKVFSMPPRLAKIMVNLASCLPGMTLLDPFCGIGTILQEARLGGARVIGVDVDPWCVKAADKNLAWVKKEYGLKDCNFRVLVGDSRRLSDSLGKECVDCIVTEPDLGPVLRHVPTESHAHNVVRSLSSLYYGFLESAYEVMKRGASLVFVTPYFRTRSKAFVSLEVDRKAENLGFARRRILEEVLPVGSAAIMKQLMESGSFIDISERQLVGREIHVFRKI